MDNWLFLGLSENQCGYGMVSKHLEETVVTWRQKNNNELNLKASFVNPLRLQKSCYSSYSNGQKVIKLTTII